MLEAYKPIVFADGTTQMFELCTDTLRVTARNAIFYRPFVSEASNEMISPSVSPRKKKKTIRHSKPESKQRPDLSTYDRVKVKSTIYTKSIDIENSEGLRKRSH